MSRVRLRRATLADAEMLAVWERPPFRGEFNDFGAPASDFRAAIRHNGLVGGDRGNLIVEVVADSRPIGSVSWHGVRYGPNAESLAWNIGINLIPEARHQRFGGEAQRMLADWLLETTAVNRIEAMTDVENTAEQRALERAGFQRDGVLRGAQFRAGAWHDLAVYGLVRQSGRPG
jgi:RimJ/RimL family protein N-acetyltransferase